MDLQERPAKTGLVIKLSSETVQKLQETKALQTLPDSNSSEVSVSSETPNVPTSTTEPNPASDDGGSVSTEKSNEQKASEVKSNVSEEKPNEKHNTTPDTNIDSSWGEYAPYVTYEGETAVYTDPTTKTEYTWSTDSNSWASRNKETVETSERTYSYENDTHVYTEADGSKFFWDEEKKAWFPKVDDDFLAHYQMSYGFVDNTLKEESVPESSQSKKPKEAGGIKRKAPEEPKWFDASDDKNNTKVYVSNLPEDLKEEEFVDFMQKCGLVMRDINSHKMKVKMYMDKESGCFKGDALCTYIKIESVELALKLLDGSDFRGRKISVQPAHFQMKGDYNPALKPKKKKKKELEKLKRMQQKLFDWRPEKAVGERSKNERVVIVKNLFEPTDFDKEVQLILDYQQDLREECGKCGEVRKVVLYDRHPEGVAQITMKEPEQADAVVALINDRWFGKRKLSAEIWDGRTKYRIAETDADLNKRVDKWEKFLEGAEGEKKDTNANVKTDEPNATTSELSTTRNEPIATCVPSTMSELSTTINEPIAATSVTSTMSELSTTTNEPSATSVSSTMSELSNTTNEPSATSVSSTMSELSNTTNEPSTTGVSRTVSKLSTTTIETRATTSEPSTTSEQSAITSEPSSKTCDLSVETSELNTKDI